MSWARLGIDIYLFLGVIPVTDEFASCTLPAAERPLRLAEFSAVFDEAVLDARRIEPTRLRLDLDPGRETAARVAGLAAAETECCSFFGFTLTVTGGGLTLDITVPAAHVAVLDALAATAGRA
jgi:hypothetical protein